MLQDLSQRFGHQALVAAVAGLIALTFLAGYVYLVKPSLDRHRELARARVAEKLELEAQSARVDPQDVSEVEQKLAQLQDQLEGGLSDIPIRQMESFVIDALGRISQRHGVALEGVKPGEMGKVLVFDELPYDIHVTGGYFRLFAWLQDVERELRPMIVKHFEMDQRDPSRGPSLRLRLVAYRTRAT